jgi:hypothetical protein
VDKSDVRDPQGFDRSRVRFEPTPAIEHYGKAVSAEQWDEKCRFYAELFPAYSEKWLARMGKAVHEGVSDFGAPLAERGHSYSPSVAPALYRSELQRGIQATVESLFYGRLGCALNRLWVEESS